MNVETYLVTGHLEYAVKLAGSLAVKKSPSAARNRESILNLVRSNREA